MRVVVLTGIPQVAASYTEIVRAAGHEVPAVIVPRSSAFAREQVEGNPPGLDVLFADTKSSLPRLLRAYEPDVGLCTGFPWLVTREALDVPRLGIVNGHPSLLPRYRGPFPLAWAVRNGEREIGMTYHFMDRAFDTGNILVQKPFPLDPEETWETLVAKLAAASAELLPGVLEQLERGDPGKPQEGPGEYQSRFEDEYAVVDPARTAAETHLQVRAWGFVPPFARVGPVLERNGTRLRIGRTSLTEVEGAERLECIDGPLWLVETTTVD